MNERINKEPSVETVNGLFVRDKKEADAAASVENPVPENPENPIPEVEETDLVSTIFSIKDGFGFIKDEKINNVFFYYDSVTNMDFDELYVGMKVRYLCEEDMERSKRDGAPRYRATKVTVIE
jgi:cold shock CspA family protein